MKLFYFDWCKRNGYDFYMVKDCWVDLNGFLENPDLLPHYRGIYIHIFNYGGHFGWKSRKCYDE